MAEYAGLEIRIGGNTTKLTNALKAPTKAAAELQREIRQITSAMRFDPTNLGNVETRIRITGDRMQSLQSKAQLARKAMEQLGDSATGLRNLDGTPKTVRQIADETQNLALEARQADERFNGLTGTLAKVYEAWNRMARDKGADFAKDALGIDARTAERLMGTTTTLGEFKRELHEINAERASGLDFKPVITPDQLAALTKLKELNFHGMFEQGTGLDAMVAQARDLGVAIEDSAVANVRELQAAFRDAQTEKKALDDAATFQKMGVDVQRIDSEVEGLTRDMRRLDDGITSVTKSDGFQAVEAEVRKVDAALDKVNEDLRTTGEAMRADPKSVQLAARYYDDLQQKVSLSEEKSELLKRQMDMLDASGAREAAESHQDLAKWVEDSAEAARVAQKDLSEQRATVASLEGEYKTLKQTVATMRGDSAVAEFGSGVAEWRRQTEQLDAAMDALKGRLNSVKDAQTALGKAQANFDDATKSADELRSKLEALQSEQRELNELFEQNDPSVDYAKVIQRLDELEDEIPRVEKAYEDAQDAIEKCNKQLSAQQGHAADAQDALDRQQKAVDDLKESVDALAKTPDVRLFQDSKGEIESAQEELVKMEGELDRAKGKERELAEAYDSAYTENELAKTAQAARDTSRKLGETQASINGVNEEIKKTSSILNASTVKSIGMTLSATVTPAVTALGYKMVDASSTVDAAYRDMRKTVQGTEEQFEHLRSAAIEFSRTHVTSADQILSIEAIGGELGIATENLETFAEVISNLDVATNLDVEGAAEALGHLSNILHLTEEDYVGFSDALVRLGNNGASTESEIANIAERIGSMGSIVHMSGADILAWSSTIASTGQNAEAAGTAISKTMSFMETAVAAAGGTLDTSFEAINAAVQEGGDRLTVFASLAGQTADEFVEAWEGDPQSAFDGLKEQLDKAKGDLQMIADVAHMSADEFAKTWESDPTAALEAFIKGLNDLEGAEGSADKVLQSLGITSTRQKQAIEGLMQTVGGLDDNLKMSRDAWGGVSDEWGEAGDAANEAAKKAEGFSGQIEILKNMWQNFLAELGEGAAPWIQRISGVISDLTGWFSGLTSGMKESIVAAGGIAAALGPVLSIGGTIGSAKKDFDKWANSASSAMTLVKTASKLGMKGVTEATAKGMGTLQKFGLVAANVGMSLVKGLAIGAAVAGIVAIGAALKDLYDRYQDHVKATQGLSKALEGVGKSSKDAAGGIDGTKRSLGELVEDANRADSRLADLARTVEDSNRQYGTFAGQMDYYADTIEKLGGKSDRSQEETYKLQAALEAVNEQCNTTYGLDNYGNIIDTQTGKIQENTDAIFANIDARKQQALIEHYSDDLAKTTEELATAQAGYNETREEYEKLISDAGKKSYIADQMSKPGMDRTKAELVYREALRQTTETMDEYRREVIGAEDAMGKIEGRMGAAQEELDKITETNRQLAEAEEQLARRTETVTADVTGNMRRMSDAADALGKSDADFNRMAERLEAVHVSAEELNDVDMSRLASSFDGSMEQVIAALEEGGVHMDTWNAALEQAPGAAERMGSLTAAAFDSMYEIAGHDLNDTMTLIAGLDSMQVGDKTFYIGDNGSIVDSQGRIYDIRNDIAAIPTEVITTYYADDADAMRKALDLKQQLVETGKQSPTPTIDVNDKATGKNKSIQESIKKTGAMKPTPTVNLNDLASVPIRGIMESLGRLPKYTEITVATVEKTVRQATGGINNRPVIPRHATGYIAVGPTLTNQGWIGEDGVEAVANWATGGAVVPLTNTKYMLPIADAIADGMARRAPSSPQIDYDRLGAAVASALAGMGVMVNGRALVGEIVSDMDRALGRRAKLVGGIA